MMDSQSNAPGKPKVITYSRIVDLSHVIDRDIPVWPEDPAVEFQTVARVSDDGYYLRRFSMGEHSATHMNAPKSFHTDGEGIDAYSAESLVVPASVIDISEKTAGNADYALSVKDVVDWERQHGCLKEGSVVLLNTGWARKWADPAAYFNQDATEGLHFPGFGGDATEFLLEERLIGGVGTDAAGVDPGQDRSFATNVCVLDQRRIVLESLANLDQLPPTGTTLVIGVLRLRDGSGSPAAVTAFVP